MLSVLLNRGEQCRQCIGPYEDSHGILPVFGPPDVNRALSATSRFAKRSCRGRCVVTTQGVH
eukprot:1292211-Lingulodinium_polyedra.AAC.1